MNIRNIFFIGSLGLPAIFGCAAMDHSPTCEGLMNLDHFTLKIVDSSTLERTFIFNTYSFATLTEDEQNAFDGIFDLENAVNNLGDEEIAKRHMEAKMKQTWAERKAVSQKRLELAKKNIQENGGDVAKGKYWIIWEINNQGSKKPVAQLGLAPCDVGQYEDKYKHVDVLELGLNLHKDYRRVGVGELIIPEFLKYLRNFLLYKGAAFGIRTTTIDSDTIAMAKVLGFTPAVMAVPWTTLLADGKTEHTVNLDLYMEQKSSKN